MDFTSTVLHAGTHFDPLSWFENCGVQAEHLKFKFCNIMGWSIRANGKVVILYQNSQPAYAEQQ